MKKIRISLTQFVDYISKTGTPRLTQVRKMKAQSLEPFDIKTDYWKPLRDGILKFHRDGHTVKSELDELVSTTDPKKLTNYALNIKGYKKFLGKKSFESFSPPQGAWEEPGERGVIRVNPELGLVLNGEQHLVKLYFKSQPLSKARVDMILCLMAESLPGVEATYTLLNVSEAKAYSTKEQNPNLVPLLVGEAAGLLTMWSYLG